ncbi:unnamed protein product, partial [Trichobilharzia regenti]
DRHAESSKSASAILPYEAVSWCEDQAEIDSQKDRTPKRTKVAPLKRSKRTVNNSLDAALSSSKAGKMHILYDGVRELENNIVERHEELREPVLLKLAKSDGRILQGDELPKKTVKVPAEKRLSDRSIWSVVYSREQCSSSSFGDLSQRSQFEESGTSAKDIFECHSGLNHSNDSGIGSQTQSALRCSSYPPTPSLSPHLPSSSPSNVSDDTTLSFGHFRPEFPNRPVSRSSHSSSGSGAGPFDQHPVSDHSGFPPTVLNVNSTKIINPIPLSAGKCKVSGKIPTVCIRKQRIGSNSSLSFVPNDTVPVMSSRNDMPINMYSLKNNPQETDYEAAKNELRRNGFHGWISDERRTDNVKRLLAFQRISGSSRNQRILLQQTPRQVKGVQFAPSFVSQYYQGERSESTGTSAYTDTSNFIQPNVTLPSEKSGRLDLMGDSLLRTNCSSEPMFSDHSDMITKDDEIQEFVEDLGGLLYLFCVLLFS